MLAILEFSMVSLYDIELNASQSILDQAENITDKGTSLSSPKKCFAEF
jgi:hypothetical protein